MTTSLWLRPSDSSTSAQADVVVVGAGLTGLSLAYWLSELKPGLKVIVVDRAGVGEGASGRNAGFHTAGSVNFLAEMIRRLGVREATEWWQLKSRGLLLLREQLKTVLPAVEFSQAGSTTLFQDDERLSEVASLVQHATKVERVSEDELSKQGLAGFAGGLRLTQDASLHPAKLMQALHQMLLTRGVKFHLGESVGWFDGETLLTERRRIRCEQVFLAINGFAGQFEEELARLVTPQRGQILAVAAPSLKLQGNFYDPAQRVYFRLDSQQRLILGGRRTVDEDRENTAVDQISSPVQAALEQYAQTLLGPSLEVVARWSGIMGFTADERPLIHVLKRWPQVTFVGGYSGHGMGMAFGHARLAVTRFLGVPSGG